MKDPDDSTDVGTNEDHVEQSMVVIDIAGKDASIWGKRRPRFVERILNIIERIKDSDLVKRNFSKNNIEETIDDLALSARLKMKNAQIMNLERQTSIKVKLSEAKLNEAKAKDAEAGARLKNSQAKKLDAEIERDKVLESLTLGIYFIN